MCLDTILDTVYPLPSGSRSALKAISRMVTFPKGHRLLTAEKTEQKLYFIRKGIVRAYASQKDQDITFWLGKEGDPVLSMSSYVENGKGYEHIELLEDCELFLFSAKELQQLYQEDIHIANWGRKLAERELIQTERRLIARQFRTASERYKTLLEEHPDLIQRVALGHIASYLGITQVSLSRIRATIR